MLTVDRLLLQIINLPNIDNLIPTRDIKVLRSMGLAIDSDLFITENQSKLLSKILKEHSVKISAAIEEDIGNTLSAPTWSKPFRLIEQVRKLQILKDNNGDPNIFIEFTFNSEIRKVLQGDLSKKVEGLNQLVAGKVFSADLTEKNIVALVDGLRCYNFEVDEVMQSYYDTIKSWKQEEVVSNFLITNITHQNFQKHITSDLGLETTIDRNIITDRSMRYRYITNTPKVHGETLTEYLANRQKTKVWVDKNQHSLDDIFHSLLELRRLPVLVVFDNASSEKCIENLTMLDSAICNNNLSDSVGIYFRISNDDVGKQFNSLIANNKYNMYLQHDTKVAAIQSGKLPKFFLTTSWKPMSVIVLDSQMGLRHGKTAVYSSCCDLVIEWANEPALIDKRIPY
jgi:hypothetical protein